MIKLNKVKEIYLSNVDEFTLYQCQTCREYWLYRKLEENWVDNLRFGFNEYESWYIGIAKEDLDKVVALEFDKILLTHGYLHLSTTDELEGSNWKKIKE
ncbi:MAG TPA: hypothetical protein EYG82_00850 [Sulfurovum sp.]|nr:hypothetical protein [Sulfurovum sp.]